MEYSDAVLFSKSSIDQREIANLGSKAIIILASLWSGSPRRNPFINGHFVVCESNPVKSAFRPEEIAAGTGFEVSRFHGIQGVRIIGEEYKHTDKQGLVTWRRKKPDITGICGGKRPSFVIFRDEVGYDDRELFDQSMAIAAELASFGYYGSISCRSGAVKYVNENPERCRISISEYGLLSVAVRWGDEALVGSLLDFCRAEKFTEMEGWEDYEKPRKTA